MAIKEPRHTPDRLIGFAAAAATVVTFAVEWTVPRTSAVHMFYALPILLTSLIPYRRSTEVTVGIAMLLTIAGFWGGTGPATGVAVMDHVMAGGLFIATGAVVAQAKRLQRRRVASEQALREGQETLQRLVQHLPAGVVVHNTRSQIVLANDQAAELLGLGANDLNGRRPSDPTWHFVRPDGTPMPAEEYPVARVLNSRGPVRGLELGICLEHGETPTWVVVNAFPEFDAAGRLRQIVTAFVDVTDRKRATDALRSAKDDLEDRVAARTRELVDRAAQLQRLASDLTIAEQRAREDLAKVLHDGLQQLLFAARLRADRLVGTGATELTRRDAERVVTTLDEAIATTRALSVELAPPVLRESGLAAALEWMGDWVRQTHGLTVQLSVDPAGNPEAWDVRVLIFESVRELLFNVVKHAGVTEARLEFAPDGDDRFRVTLSHGGAGVDVAGLDTYHAVAGGLGLFSIRERLRLLGGRFEIESEPGKGARFTLVGPRQPAMPSSGVAAFTPPAG